MNEDGERYGDGRRGRRVPGRSRNTIYEAILAREKTGDSFPDRNAVEAMEEPLHRLTGAAVLFSVIATGDRPAGAGRW